MDNDKMEVDVDTPTAPSSSPITHTEHSLPSSSTEGLLKSALNDAQLTAFRHHMQGKVDLWKSIMDNGQHWRHLIAHILHHATFGLVDAGLGDSTISRDPSETDKIVGTFSEAQLSEWISRVQKGVAEGDWDELALHPILRKQVVEAHQMARVSSETREEQATRLHNMFDLEYRGGAAQRLIDALEKYGLIYDAMKHFGRIILIIQSSCTGKSRLVKQIGNTIPTLSICFRQSELPEAGWPPNDEPARRFLLKSRPDNDRYKGEELAGAFLGAVAHVVAERIRQCKSSDLMADWQLDNPTNTTKSHRYKCFTDVEAKAEELLRINKQGLSEIRVSSTIRNVDAVFRLLTLPSFQALSLVLKEREVKYFVFAFDECSQLNARRRPPESDKPPVRTGMSLIALQRIIKAYDDYVSDVPFWFLLLDTNSSVVDMAPRSKNASSHRFVGQYTSLPPWPFLGFNQMAETDSSVLAKQIQLPTDVLSIQHLKKYGRPYWSTLADEVVVQAAFEKLFSGVEFNPQKEEHIFAAFAVRACLEIGSGEASERLITEAVRSHMRILTRVTGGLLITASPSEPMLAIAAAKALNKSEDTYRQAMDTLLDKLILKGLVLDRGHLGELSTRILFLRARDQATVSECRSYISIDRSDGKRTIPALRLSIFLQSLLGNDLGIAQHFTEKSGIRNNLLHDTAEVWINFTHFVQLSTTIDEVTEPMLLEAWSSGFAFQCTHNQPVIDGFIVAYFGRLDDPFDISNLFVVPWQTKAKSDPAELALAPSLTAPFLVNKDGLRRKPWHVVILMDLVSTSAFGSAQGPHCDVSWGRAERPTGKLNGGNWRGYADSQCGEEEDCRYCLNIRGHFATQYPVLKGLDEQFNQLFQRSLGCDVAELVEDAELMESAMERIKFEY